MTKRKSVLWCTLLGIVFTGISCQKDHIYDPTKVKHTSELKVPAGFDWNTSRTVDLSISSPVATVAQLYSDRACTSADLLASVPVSETSAQLQLEVAASAGEVYLQYPTKERNKVMAIAVPLQVTKATTNVKLPEDAVQPETTPDHNGKLLRLFNKWTLMFEDNWPEKGDYDFNDFVVDYTIETAWTQGDFAGDSEPEIYDQEGISVTLKFRAIGGALPYHPGLQLDGTPAKFIDNPSDFPQTIDGITVKLLNPGSDEPAVFVFEGTDKLKGQNGARYFNTEAGHQVAAENLPEITFHIQMNSFGKPVKSEALAAAANTKNQNFFLQLKEPGGKEIHLRGYEPTSYYTTYAEDGKDMMDSQVKYYSQDGFVWGFKVPHGIAHAIERTDFKEAYPHFALWVNDGGQTNDNWFKYPNLSCVIE